MVIDWNAASTCATVAITLPLAITSMKN